MDELRLDFDAHEGFWRYLEAGEDLKLNRLSVSVEEIALAFPYQVKPLNRALVEQLKDFLRAYRSGLGRLVVTRRQVLDPRYEEPQWMYVLLDGHHRFLAQRELYEEDPAGPWASVEVVDLWSPNPNSAYMVGLASLVPNLVRAEVSPLERVLALLAYVRGASGQADVAGLGRWLEGVGLGLGGLRRELGEGYAGFLEALRRLSPTDPRYATREQVWEWGLGLFRAMNLPGGSDLLESLWRAASPSARALLLWLEPFEADPLPFLSGVRALRRSLGERLLEALLEPGVPQGAAMLAQKARQAGVEEEVVLAALRQKEPLEVLRALLPSGAAPAAPALEPLDFSSPARLRKGLRRVGKHLERLVGGLKRRDLARAEVLSALQGVEEAVRRLDGLLGPGPGASGEAAPPALRLPPQAAGEERAPGGPGPASAALPEDGRRPDEPPAAPGPARPARLEGPELAGALELALQQGELALEEG